MSLKETLLADLQRQYDFDGITHLSPTIWGILRRALHPHYLPVVLCRLAHSLHSVGLLPLARMAALLNFLLFGIEIAMRCQIGDGLYLPHTTGTVIGALRVGRNAVIYHGVTIGAKEMDRGYHPDQRPVIGDNVIIGSGAKVLGGITIGNNVIIGANAVVTQSFPDNVIVAGIPASILRSLQQPSP